MSRGGKRDNAGRKSGWVNLETKLIRIPVAIESQLMAIAKRLDQGETVCLDKKTKTANTPVAQTVQTDLFDKGV